MTLIAFATSATHADIVTDTATYNLTTQGRTTKVMPLPHLDTAVMEQGSTGFAHRWRYRLLQLDRERVTDFDDLHRRTPAELRRVWADMATDTDRENAEHGSTVEVSPSVIFHVGRSIEAGRFKAYGYASFLDFEPVDLSNGMVLPSPLDMRPTTVELERLARHLHDYTAGDPEGTRQARAFITALSERPPFVPPTTRKGWVDLAKTVRADRSTAHIASGLKVIVGGDVMHTTLRAGEMTHRRIHTYSDAGAEFARVVAGTLHPLSQLATCEWCDSGAPFVDCCLTERNGHPCPCQSGRDFDTCCSVHADHTAPAPALAGATV